MVKKDCKEKTMVNKKIWRKKCFEKIKNKYLIVLGISVFWAWGFIGCFSLGDVFLTNQQKQWKTEGRNIKTGLFDEPYSGKSFHEKVELEAFMQTAEYNMAVANYTAWKNAYNREQNRVDEENRRIQIRNQDAFNDMQRRAEHWLNETKIEGIRKGYYSPNSFFYYDYEYNKPWFTEQVAILKVDNEERARNVFTCKKELLIKNQVGDYNPNVKY
jgi:hypothetical protein